MAYRSGLYSSASRLKDPNRAAWLHHPIQLSLVPSLNVRRVATGIFSPRRSERTWIGLSWCHTGHDDRGRENTDCPRTYLKGHGLGVPTDLA